MSIVQIHLTSLFITHYQVLQVPRVLKLHSLKEIILGDSVVAEITAKFAFELLSHMKGGPSIEVLLDLALADDAQLAKQAADVLKTQVFLYDADTSRLEAAFKAGNASC